MSECIVAAALDACAQLKVRMEPVKAWLTAADANGMIAAQADFKHPLGLPQEIVNTFSGFMSLAQAGALMGCGGAGQEPAWQQLTSFCHGSFMPFDMHIDLCATGMFVPKGRHNLEFLTTPFTPGNDNTCFTKLATPGTELALGHGLVDYWIFGCAVSEVEIDCLTGAKSIIRSDIIQDVGNSLNAQIDIGQTEGAFVQGLAFMLQEEVLIDHQTGFNHSQDTWEYKPPLVSDIPLELNVELHNKAPVNERGINYIAGSKAVGEPPILLSLSAVSAIKAAIKSSRVERGLSAEFEVQLPLSVDRIQQALELDQKEFTF